jgi:hypothetical protein
MSLRLDGNIVYLEGACGVEDAEPLLQAVQSVPGIVMNVGGATHLHAAIVQVLMALRPALTGVPPDPFLRQFVLPAAASRVA